VASLGVMGARWSQVGDAGSGDDRKDPARVFRAEKSIKAICREFRVLRKVVRKVIRSDATEFRYERGAQPRLRIDPWRDRLDGRTAS